MYVYVCVRVCVKKGKMFAKIDLQYIYFKYIIFYFEDA